MNGLMPLLIVVAGTAANVDKLKSLIGYSKRVAVQSELHEITKMMVLDRISGSDLPRPEDFGGYLKTNMRLQKTKEGLTRDASKDQFGFEYKVEYTRENHVRVTSAGADGKFGTTDDLYSDRGLD